MRPGYSITIRERPALAYRYPDGEVWAESSIENDLVPVLLMMAAAPVFRAGQDRRLERTAAQAGGTASFDVESVRRQRRRQDARRRRDQLGDRGCTRRPAAALSASGAGTYSSTSHPAEEPCRPVPRSRRDASLAADASAGPYDEPEPNEWDKFQDFGHSHWHNSLIWGENLDDVSITGPGLIHGQGLVRSQHQRRPTGSGNKAIALKNSRNVTIRDITILHGGWFAILATGVDNFTIDNVKIDTNRDGIDVDACRNVRISNCTVNSPFDDGICLKSSYGLGSARATENVTITNCQVSGYDEGHAARRHLQADREVQRRGTDGTRSSSAPRATAASRTSRSPTACSTTAAGWRSRAWTAAIIEDVTITNITMRDIVQRADLRPARQPRARPERAAGRRDQPRPRSATSSRRTSMRRHGVLISGIPGHPIEDLRLSNIRIAYAGGGTTADAALAARGEGNRVPRAGHVRQHSGLRACTHGT